MQIGTRFYSNINPKHIYFDIINNSNNITLKQTIEYIGDSTKNRIIIREGYSEEIILEALKNKIIIY